MKIATHNKAVETIELLVEGETDLIAVMSTISRELYSADLTSGVLLEETKSPEIGRLVHHSVIIELNVPSYRVETAKKTKRGGPSQADSPYKSNT
jgi:hypothetical protein